MDDVVGEEEYMPTRKVALPVVVSVIVMLMYFLFGTMVFSSLGN